MGEAEDSADGFPIVIDGLQLANEVEPARDRSSVLKRLSEEVHLRQDMFDVRVEEGALSCEFFCEDVESVVRTHDRIIMARFQDLF